MAAETVKFYVTDQILGPILGVLVRVFDETGTTFITQDYTVDVGGDAVAEVTLDGNDPPNNYTIRMSKTGVAFDGSLGDDSKSPQLIAIYSPPAAAPTGKNDFNIQGETFERPTATDPNLCRCSGFFRDGSGRALPNLDIFLINKFLPAIVEDAAVLGERLDMRTDEDGYLEVDLFRGGEYSAYVQSIQAASCGGMVFLREIVVPDRSSANIADLLLPVVSEVTWDPAAPSVAAGDTLDLTPTVKASDYRELEGTANEDVMYEVEDESVATISVQADKIVVTGVAAGSTNIIVTRRDQTIVKIPDPGIVGSPLAITVT
jgi:uncharacterized protein YjdB